MSATHGGARAGAGRKPKPLAEHLREGTYRPDRHGPIGTEVKTDARELEAVLPRSQRSRRPKTLGPEVARFFAENLRHSKGALAGERFVLEPWQRDFLDEFCRLDESGRRLYRVGLLGVPRGNGKSPVAAGLALETLLTRQAADVFVAAAARSQGRVVLDFARDFVETGPLAEWVRVQRNDLTCPARRGTMKVLSAEGSLQHGLGVDSAVIDELHAFSQPKHEELHVALRTALGKRPDSFELNITTAGWDRQTLLGRMYDASLKELELEAPTDCLTIGRDVEAGVLFWWYAAPESADLDDEDVWRRCNPASWKSLREMRRELAAPGFKESDFRRLHLNQWTAGADMWISPERWAACADAEAEIPDGATIFVGIDASWSGDATAVAWAHRRADGRVALRSHVWSALPETEAHSHVAGGNINLEAVEEFVVGLARRYRVQEVVFDPAYFARSAELIASRGVTIASIDQRSAPMREAYSQLYEAVGSQAIAHDGDPVLTAHVLAAAATLDADGHWKVRKAHQSRKIDALVASVIAYSRAARRPRSVYQDKGLLVLGV